MGNQDWETVSGFDEDEYDSGYMDIGDDDDGEEVSGPPPRKKKVKGPKGIYYQDKKPTGWRSLYLSFFQNIAAGATAVVPGTSSLDMLPIKVAVDPLIANLFVISSISYNTKEQKANGVDMACSIFTPDNTLPVKWSPLQMNTPAQITARNRSLVAADFAVSWVGKALDY